MQEVDALTVSVVVDNSSDMLSTRPAHIASELRVLLSAGMREFTGEGLCSAHHGLSLAVTARLGAENRTILFDARAGSIRARTQRYAHGAGLWQH
jgi:7,8-dihydropterin-6-yl-methyl-4-(beta-D-ribofuranosyl)aminobenzene 5'-phosphate synthase